MLEVWRPERRLATTTGGRLATTTTRATRALSLALVTALIGSAPAYAQSDPDPSVQGLKSSAALVAAATPKEPDSDFQLGAATSQAFGFTVFQHTVRLKEKKTRMDLGGSFFKDWFKAASNTGRNWDDGGKFFTNYIAHPMGGGVYANIYRQNDERRKRLEIGEPGYIGMIARAMAFAAAISTQFEIGPVSEASIGNVGLRYPNKMGWVDFVITPTLGTAWMVGEDVIDDKLLTRMDGANTVLRNTLRGTASHRRACRRPSGAPQ